MNIQVLKTMSGMSMYPITKIRQRRALLRRCLGAFSVGLAVANGANAALLETSWIGGDGAWKDATKWTTGTVPDNTDTIQYQVSIDKDPNVQSTVSLTGRIEPFMVSGLEVKSGDTLVITQRGDIDAHLMVSKGDVHNQGGIDIADGGNSIVVRKEGNVGGSYIDEDGVLTIGTSSTMLLEQDFLKQGGEMRVDGQGGRLNVAGQYDQFKGHVNLLSGGWLEVKEFSIQDVEVAVDSKWAGVESKLIVATDFIQHDSSTLITAGELNVNGGKLINDNSGLIVRPDDVWDVAKVNVKGSVENAGEVVLQGSRASLEVDTLKPIDGGQYRQQSGSTTLSDRAKLRAEFYDQSGGETLLDRSTLEAPTWVTGGNFQSLGGQITGYLWIRSGGSFEAQRSRTDISRWFSNNGNGRIGDVASVYAESFNNRGNMTVDGRLETELGGVDNDAVAKLWVKGSVTSATSVFNSGSMSIDGRLVTEKEGVTNRGTMWVDGSLTSAAGVTNRGRLSVDGSVTSATDIYNRGRLWVSGSVTSAAEVTNRGYIYLNNGTIKTGAGKDFVNEGGGDLHGPGTINSTAINKAIFRATRISAPDPERALSSTSSLDPQNVALSTGIGQISVTDSYIQTDTGQLWVDIGGTSFDTGLGIGDYGRLAVAERAVLFDATLFVASVLDGVVLQEGDVFDILTAKWLEDADGNLLLPEDVSRFRFSSLYPGARSLKLMASLENFNAWDGYDTIRLTAVAAAPIPGTMMLMLVALFALYTFRLCGADRRSRSSVVRPPTRGNRTARKN